MKHILVFIFACLTLLSCEKADLSQLNEPAQEGRVEVTFQIAAIEQIPFSNTTANRKSSSLVLSGSAPSPSCPVKSGVSDSPSSTLSSATIRGASSSSRSVALTSLCSRFSIALFQGDTKVKSVNQTSTDAESAFGSITLSLLPGEYQLVAIAHNGLGNCTISSPGKITFKDNKLTDTFYYYGTINVQASNNPQQPSLVPITLTRPVSMFRMNISDAMPSTVSKMQFYYTGGSSTFNAVTGYGCVESRQTETFSVSESSYDKPTTFEIYTFPHEANDILTVKVTAFDSSANTITEKTFENIPIRPNIITQHTTTFFEGTSSDPSTTPTTCSTNVSIYDDGKWADTLNY